MLEEADLGCDQLGAEQVITPVQRSGKLSNTPKRTNKHKEKSSLKQNIKTCPLRASNVLCFEVSCYVQLKARGRSIISHEFRRQAKIFPERVLAQKVTSFAPIGTLSESELEPNAFSALRRLASHSVLCIFRSPKLMVVRPPCVAVLLQQHHSFPHLGVYK